MLLLINYFKLQVGNVRQKTLKSSWTKLMLIMDWGKRQLSSVSNLQRKRSTNAKKERVENGSKSISLGMPHQIPDIKWMLAETITNLGSKTLHSQRQLTGTLSYKSFRGTALKLTHIMSVIGQEKALKKLQESQEVYALL
jgi:hypothetical protein